MKPGLAVIATVVLCVTTLVTFGGMGYAYHRFLQDIYADENIEVSSGETLLCALECSQEGTSVSTPALGTDIDLMVSSDISLDILPTAGGDTPPFTELVASVANRTLLLD